MFESDVSCVRLDLKFLNYPLLYSGRWMAVGIRLSAMFVACPGLINARTIQRATGKAGSGKRDGNGNGNGSGGSGTGAIPNN